MTSTEQIVIYSKIGLHRRKTNNTAYFGSFTTVLFTNLRLKNIYLFAYARKKMVLHIAKVIAEVENGGLLPLGWILTIP